MSYKCEHCSKELSMKPWMIYNHRGDEKYLCSYLCCRKIDTMIFNHMIVNNEDFEDLRPIKQVKPEFSMLTTVEINDLDYIQKDEYYKNLNEFMVNNPERYIIINNIIHDMDYIDDYCFEYSDYSDNESDDDLY